MHGLLCLPICFPSCCLLCPQLHPAISCEFLQLLQIIHYSGSIFVGALSARSEASTQGERHQPGRGRAAGREAAATGWGQESERKKVGANKDPAEGVVWHRQASWFKPENREEDTRGCCQGVAVNKSGASAFASRFGGDP